MSFHEAAKQVDTLLATSPSEAGADAVTSLMGQNGVRRYVFEQLPSGAWLEVAVERRWIVEPILPVERFGYRSITASIRRIAASDPEAAGRALLAVDGPEQTYEVLDLIETAGAVGDDIRDLWLAKWLPFFRSKASLDTWERPLSKLAVVLVVEKNPAGFELLELILGPRLDLQEPNDNPTRVASYWYGECSKFFDTSRVFHDWAGLTWLLGVLDRVLALTRSRYGGDDGHSFWYRNDRLAGHDVRAALTWLTLSVAQDLWRRSRSNHSRVALHLTSFRWSIGRRLALELAASPGTARSVVRVLVADERLWESPSLEATERALLRSVTEQAHFAQKLLARVRLGPQPWQKAYWKQRGFDPRELTRAWRLSRLSCFPASALEAGELAAINTLTDDDPRQAERSAHNWSAETDDVVIDALRDGASIPLLGKRVMGQPARFLERQEDLPDVVIGDILLALRMAGGAIAVDLRPHLLALCLRGARSDQAEAARWAVRALEPFLRNESILEEHREAVWAVIEAAGEQTEPQGQGAHGQDPYDRAINNPRSLAIEAAMQYLSDLKQRPESPTKWTLDEAPQVRAFLQRQLEPKWHSDATHAMLGLWYRWLVAYDRDWAIIHTDAFFPPAIDLAWLERAAWTAHLRNPVYGPAFEILLDRYERMAASLPNENPDDAVMAESAQAGLGRHLLTLYWQGKLALTDKLLLLYLGGAGPNLRAYLINFLGRSGRNTDSIPEPLLARITALWDWFAANPTEAGTELAAFGAWVDEQPVHFEARWLVKQLARIPAGEIERPSVVLKLLNAVSEKHPVIAFDALTHLIDLSPRLRGRWADDWIPVFRAALANPSSRERARDRLDQLAVDGFSGRLMRDLLNSDA